jgi:hypothetical protein
MLEGDAEAANIESMIGRGKLGGGSVMGTAARLIGQHSSFVHTNLSWMGKVQN